MTKSTITRERIQRIIRAIDSEAYDEEEIREWLSSDEIMELSRMALAAMDSEPVAWTWHYREQWHVTNDERRAEFVAKDGDVAVLPLYRHAQPVPVVVPDGLRLALSNAGIAAPESDEMLAATCEKHIQALVAWVRNRKPFQSAPVVPDGYVMVPMRLTAENGAKGALSGEFSETKFVNCPECFGDDECETCDGSGRIEITVPVTWTTIKDIWAKGVEHFAAAPQEVKGE
ncbi:hypothetical protein ACTZM2_04310 [Klebsiella pneumoniae]